MTLRLYYRKIYITGLQNVKADVPQLVTSNHPSGFIEPLVMACTFPKSLHFLVRGDVFDNPVLKPILIATHQAPIYRFRDGFSKMRENDKVIDGTAKILLEDKNLLIFSEGSTESIKKLRPLQKGTPRILWQTLEKSPQKRVEILPVGINFTKSGHFSGDIMLRIGEPISAQKIYQKANGDQKEFNDVVLDVTYNAIHKNVIHLAKQDRLPILERLFCVARGLEDNPVTYPTITFDNTKLDREKAIAYSLDSLDNIQYEQLLGQAATAEKILKTEGFKWTDLSKRPAKMIDYLLLMVGFPMFFLGILLHGIPFLMGKIATRKLVEKIEFVDSIHMVSTMLFVFLLYVVLFIMGFFNLFYFGLLAIMAVTLVMSKYYYSFLQVTYFGSKGKQLDEMKNNIKKMFKSVNV